MTLESNPSQKACICSAVSRWTDRAGASGIGPLLTRSMVGVVMVFHGAQKLFGWFGGYGIEGTAEFFKQMGIPLPTLSVILAGGTEFFGGLLLIIGLLTRPMAGLIAFTMFVGVLTAHRGAFSLQHNGMEYALTLAIVSLGLVLTGPGRISLDRKLKLAIA